MPRSAPPSRPPTSSRSGDEPTGERDARREKTEPGPGTAKPRARGTRDNIVSPVRRPPSDPGVLQDETVASIAHDLKNPLSVIMLEALLLDQHLAGRDAPAIRPGLERISLNAAYMDRLISDLLDLASVDAGRLELRFARTELVRLVQDALLRAVSTVDRGRIRVETGPAAFAMIDATRIERVVANLVVNALKFSPRDSRVTVRLEVRAKRACISVLDTGPGLTVEQARQAFDRHSRGGHAAEGYGLGLYISRRIIEAHGGRIGIASAPGKGSRFFFELPVAA